MYVNVISAVQLCISTKMSTAKSRATKHVASHPLQIVWEKVHPLYTHGSTSIVVHITALSPLYYLKI